jgi:hypothetical protein
VRPTLEHEDIHRAWRLRLDEVIALVDSDHSEHGSIEPQRPSRIRDGEGEVREPVRADGCGVVQGSVTRGIWVAGGIWHGVGRSAPIRALRHALAAAGGVGDLHLRA